LFVRGFFAFFVGGESDVADGSDANEDGGENAEQVCHAAGHDAFHIPAAEAGYIVFAEHAPGLFEVVAGANVIVEEREGDGLAAGVGVVEKKGRDHAEEGDDGAESEAGDEPEAEVALEDGETKDGRDEQVRSDEVMGPKPDGSKEANADDVHEPREADPNLLVEANREPEHHGAGEEGDGVSSVGRDAVFDDPETGEGDDEGSDQTGASVFCDGGKEEVVAPNPEGGKEGRAEADGKVGDAKEADHDRADVGL